MVSTSRVLRLILFLPVLFFFNLSDAQDLFQPGIVYGTKGDTLRGMINYYGWTNPRPRISFVENGKDSAVVLTPNAIRGFETGGNKYRSAAVKTEMTLNNIELLVSNPNLRLANDTVFLRLIVQGEKSLWFFRNKVHNDQFYIDENGSQTLLIYKKYIKESAHNTNTVGENKGYLNQLRHYFSDCESLDNQLKNTKYSESSLVELYDKYYKCTGAEKVYTTKREKIVYEKGVLAGLSLTELKENYLQNFGLAFKPSIMPSAGLYLNIIFPETRGRISAYNELLFTNFNNKSEALSEPDYIYNLSLTYLKLNILFRYTFKNKESKVNFFLNAGISNGMIIHEINQVKVGGQTQSWSPYAYTRKFEQGLLAGAGVVSGRLSAEIRAEFGNGFSFVEYYPTSVNRAFILLGYRF
ncbi:MAG: hypothetical protein CVT93_10225 [Bacteroidetes bacterium HGW-Bacteroidetes-10]|nr:MAG: hypothetical protein CVT93_10225 [Bacteroidetes bacterium HGW-Bacteroidetes-10]